MQTHIFDILAINNDFPLEALSEAEEHLKDRRFTSTSSSDDAYFHSSLNIAT